VIITILYTIHEMASKQETRPGDDTEDEAGTEVGEIFQLLSNHRRRYALHYCKQASGPVELGELAEQVAASELEKPIEELTSTERKRVYTSLQQTHLPTLERAGIVEDSREGITLTEHAADLNIYLDIVPSNSIPWGLYYTGLSAFSTLVLVGLWAELLPTEMVPVLGWMGFVVALFAVSAVVHTYQNHQRRLGEIDQPP
jgi:DNA-binding transcriptional ArsR family regulator